MKYKYLKTNNSITIYVINSQIHLYVVPYIIHKLLEYRIDLKMIQTKVVKTLSQKYGYFMYKLCYHT